MANATHRLFSALLATSLSLPASAEEALPATTEDDEVIVVSRVLSPEAATALERPAFVTTVRVDERAAETTSLAEVLAEGAGVQIRSLGGLGSFSSVSVRGASPGNTTVLVDGVPLSQLASVTSDLGRPELATFEAVDVYRGAPPLQFGGATLGGAINLRTRLNPPGAPPSFSVTLGGGSFGARHAGARFSGGVGETAVTAIASYRGADGDYPFLSDNGTNLNPDDDAELRRKNNGFNQLDLVTRVGRRASAQAGARLSYRTQGVPGFGSIQTEESSLATLSSLVDAVSRWRPRRTLHTAAHAYGFFERTRYRDRQDEVGLGAQDRRYHTYSGGLNTSAEIAVGSHRGTGGIELRFDAFDELDVSDAQASSNRGYRPALGLTLADDIPLADDAILLIPAVRLDVMHTRPAVDSNAALGADADARTDVFASPRISSRWRLSPSVAIKGNAGLYFRAPTLMELFGDRGFVVGNPDLDPERGAAMDLGVIATRLARAGALDRMFVEVAAFATRASDVIAFVSNAGGFTGALNLGAATTAGGEISASARAFSRLTLSGSYTILWTRRASDDSLLDGTELPRRPRHQLFARADFGFDALGRTATLWTDVSLSSSSFIDAANRDPMPARTFVGLGAKIELVTGVRLGAEVKNVFDKRVEDIELSPPPSPELSRIRRAVADFFGYPLPGRALYASLEMTI